MNKLIILSNFLKLKGFKKEFFYLSNLNQTYKSGDKLLKKSSKDKLTGFCDSTASSFAWIKPSGEVVILEGLTMHESWAKKYIKENGLTIKPDIEFSEILVQQGWIKVTSSESISVNSRKTPVDAWDAFFDLLSQCPNINPEQSSVLVGESSGRERWYRVGDLIDRYASRAGGERFYSELGTRI